MFAMETDELIRVGLSCHDARKVRLLSGLSQLAVLQSVCSSSGSVWVLSGLADGQGVHRHDEIRYRGRSARCLRGTLLEPFGLKNVTVFWSQNLRHFCVPWCFLKGGPEKWGRKVVPISGRVGPKSRVRTFHLCNHFSSGTM